MLSLQICAGSEVKVAPEVRHTQVKSKPALVGLRFAVVLTHLVHASSSAPSIAMKCFGTGIDVKPICRIVAGYCAVDGWMLMNAAL